MIDGETMQKWIVAAHRDDWHKTFFGSDLRIMLGEIDRMTSALKFVKDMASEELPYAKVGTGAEVALRHIARRADEALSR